MALRVNACRMGRSESRGVRAASSAMARASSSAARVANSEARAVKRSMTITANIAESSSVVAARGMKTGSRSDRPVRRASSRRAAVAPTPRRNSSASASSSSFLPIPETVPYPAYRLQHAGIAAGVVQLAAQRLDVHVDGAIANDHVAAPDSVEDLAALEDPARAAQEERQQVELRAREREVVLANGRLAGARIQRELAGAERLLLRLSALRRPPQDRPDPRRDLARRERLEHVVVGADLQADHPVRLLVAAGEDDHRDVAARAQRTEEIEPVPVGQHQIEDEQIDFAGESARLPERGRLRNLEPVAPKGEGETLADGGLVVDEEDGRHRVYGGAPNWPGFSGSFSGPGMGCFSSAFSNRVSANLLLRDSTTRRRALPPSAPRSAPSRACSTSIHLRAPGPFRKSCSVAAGAARPTCRTVFLE